MVGKVKAKDLELHYKGPALRSDGSAIQAQRNSRGRTSRPRTKRFNRFVVVYSVSESR
jgi:hypothetical protein